MAHTPCLDQNHTVQKSIHAHAERTESRNQILSPLSPPNPPSLPCPQPSKLSPSLPPPVFSANSASSSLVEQCTAAATSVFVTMLILPKGKMPKVVWKHEGQGSKHDGINHQSIKQESSMGKMTVECTKPSRLVDQTLIQPVSGMKVRSISMLFPWRKSSRIGESSVSLRARTYHTQLRIGPNGLIKGAKSGSRND